MRVLLLNKFGELSASYRARLALFLPYLAEQGVECVVSTLDEPTLERLRWLGKLDEFDLAVLYHELFPHVPGPLERKMLRIPYVFDFDDAIQTLETPFTRGKTAQLIEGARITIAGSGELAKFAGLHSKDVRIIPTVVDQARYAAAKSKRKPGAPFTIGWIGTPVTTDYLKLVAEPLKKLQTSRGARIITVGAGKFDLPGVRVERKTWTEATELAELSTFDVGIMPLTDDEWARGKCGFKLVQYLAAGIPQVASPVGANSAIVADGVTGLLASTPAEWIQALERLADDPALRAKMSEASVERSRAHFSLTSAAPAFHRALVDAAGLARVTPRQSLKKS
jgi:glycosyltransferase involved in cell wall biosynthesis